MDALDILVKRFLDGLDSLNDYEQKLLGDIMTRIYKSTEQPDIYLGLTIEQVKEEIEGHIKRCSLDIDLVVDFIDESDEEYGVVCPLRIADEHWCTVDLDIVSSLPLLRGLSDECTYEQFLDCIIDFTD